MDNWQPSACPTCEQVNSLVEYIYTDDEYWLQPRDESVGTFSVDGLQGYLCKECGEICSVPHQIRANQERVEQVRNKIRAEMGLPPYTAPKGGSRIEKVK